MTPQQIAFANQDDSLGHLLTQIDTFYQDLPEVVRTAFDKLGGDLKFGCHCDLDDETEPDECVIGTASADDCINARGKTSKFQCSEWKPVVFMRQNAA